MRYLKLILEFAFRRSLMRIDIYAAVLTAIGPALFFAAGLTIPPDLTVYISLVVAAMVVATLILRVISAPYFIWKADQAEILRLNEELASPQRHARKALMEQFATEKFQLLRQLMRIKGDMRAYNDAAQIGEQTAKSLYPFAQPFLLDTKFKRYWFTFEKNMKALSALHAWRKANSPLERENEARLLKRFGFHHMLAIGAVDAMMLHLASEKEGAKAAHDKALVDAEEWCSPVDFTFALPAAANWDEINFYHSDEEPIAHPSMGHTKI
ncbi:hypothetical protein MUU53_14015 [Rhizobium lemnae]|uniref:DUF4231 domain-containing protein n=1 Tax=Rhizobium lemnae TaxID=1214924 RepID=A0ABV8EAB5_9HYPH|nr:hypothetical protein [Rhizobium lemnae]MCJ8509029.1 hypothetical protein [Rhizobium lemnae]